MSRLGLIDHLAAGRVARRVEILRDRGMRLPVNLLVSMKNRGRSSQAIAEPSCGCPSRTMRAPSPTSRNSAMVPASSTPARMRAEHVNAALPFQDDALDALAVENMRQQRRRDRRR